MSLKLNNNEVDVALLGCEEVLVMYLGDTPVYLKSLVFNTYKARAEAAGYTVTNDNCTKIFLLTQLMADEASSVYNNLELRVLADGGIMENKECLIDNLRG